MLSKRAAPERNCPESSRAGRDEGRGERQGPHDQVGARRDRSPERLAVLGTMDVSVDGLRHTYVRFLHIVSVSVVRPKELKCQDIRAGGDLISLETCNDRHGGHRLVKI